MPAAPVQQGQYGGQYLSTTSTSILYSDTGAHRDYKAWMATIANEYVTDTRGRDPSYLPNQVDHCYRVGYGGANRAENLRSCLILDYLGYKAAQEEGRRMHREPSGYFSMEAAQHRWGLYGPLAGFPTGYAVVGYMRDAYRFAEPDVINQLRYERAYLPAT